MIIDSHTHVGEPVPRGELGQQAPRVSADSLVASMDRAGIDRSITFTDKGLFFYDKSENDKIADAMRTHARRLIGFACVNPRYGLDAVEELRRAILKLGLKGLKLHPWLQNFSCTDSVLDPLFEEVTRLEIPVLIHTGYDIFSGPLSVANLAGRYPKVPIIMGHSGCCGLWYDAIKAAKRHDNLYLETSGNLSVAIEKMVENVGPDRVLFGSDTPWVDSATEVLKIRKLNLTDRDKELVLGGNLGRFLTEWRIDSP